VPGSGGRDGYWGGSGSGGKKKKSRKEYVGGEPKQLKTKRGGFWGLPKRKNKRKKARGGNKATGAPEKKTQKRDHGEEHPPNIRYSQIKRRKSQGKIRGKA